MYVLSFVVSKNVPDYSASRELNDLGYVTFDLNAGTVCVIIWFCTSIFQ